MKAKLLKALAASAFLTVSGIAAAEEPVALNEAQMDGVTAGGTAIAFPTASALGLIAAATQTQAFADVRVIQVIPTQAGQLAVVKSTSQAASSASSL